MNFHLQECMDWNS